MKRSPKSRAVVLLSGGLDSSTALYWAQHKKDWQCYCLVFEYGQRHRKEIRSALAVARAAGCPSRRVRFSLPWGGSSLLNRRETLPINIPAKIGIGPIPSTYVPARNTIFLAFGLSWADVIGAEHIVVGANALDFSGYPDCRPEFYDAFQNVARLGTRLGTQGRKPIRVWAPLLHMNKAEIVRRGIALGVPFEKTWSCYEGGKRPCGVCDSCRLRARGFESSGRIDPLISKGRS